MKRETVKSVARRRADGVSGAVVVAIAVVVAGGLYAGNKTIVLRRRKALFQTLPHIHPKSKTPRANRTDVTTFYHFLFFSFSLFSLFIPSRSPYHFPSSTFISIHLSALVSVSTETCPYDKARGRISVGVSHVGGINVVMNSAFREIYFEGRYNFTLNFVPYVVCTYAILSN